MKFDRRIEVSIGNNVKHIFESFDKIRPNNVSFSIFLAASMNEYTKNHSGLNSRLTDFTNESVSTKLPLFDAPMDIWIQSVHNLSSNDFKEMQRRMSQLRNMVQAEAERRLC